MQALGGDRVEDLHANLDEAISKGAKGAILIAFYPEEHENEWEAWGSDGTTPAERAFVYQQLIVCEVARQEPE